MFVYMTGAKQTKAYKFARAFHGPYRIKEVMETGVVVQPVDKPNQEPIRLAMDRVRRCPHQIPDTFWPTKKKGPEMEKSLPAPVLLPQKAWSDHLQSSPRTS